MSEALYWHFLPEDRRLRYGDDREVRVGETLRVEGTLKLCEHGFHASRRAIDALQYAPGPVICRVRLSGDVLEPEGEDKACASERTAVAMADATTVVHEWAIWCARQALERERAKGREPDPRSWAALKAKEQWLLGEITEQELHAAWAAAWAAARAAASAAASAAAWAAARAAASAAAWEAARAAAWGAASAAAWGAARGAASAAAWGAAWGAAWAEQGEELERRLTALLETPP